MANSHVELDFFGLHNQQPPTQPPPQPRLRRRQSFCGISKMNPEIVKSVIASASPQLPIFHPNPFSAGPGSSEKGGEAGPMTIFYNGTVSVFDLPKDKAEYIMKLAMAKNISMNNYGKIVDHSTFNTEITDECDDIMGSLNDGDMPIKRKKSLQRFFEKRKERLISVSPYSSVDQLKT